MNSRGTCKSSYLCLACLCASLYCLCFSWALWSACWILPLALHLASFQLCLRSEISAVLVTSHLFCCTTTEVQSSRGWSHDNSLSSTNAWDTCSMPMYWQAHLHSGCIEASIWRGVLAHSNDHRFSQVVPWKHYPGNVACLDKAIPFWTCTMN